MRKTAKNAIIGSLSFLLVATIMAIIFTGPLYFAWNFEAVKFGLPKIGLVDALLISFICNMLFRGSSTINPALLR